MTSGLLLSLAVITFINRYAFLSAWVRLTPGDNLNRFLSYSSYAVLTAIWAPLVFEFSPGAGHRLLSIAGWDYVIAATVAALMTLFNIRSILVVLISTGLFFVLRFLVLT